MKHRRLGQTGLRVSEMGFGAWPLGGSFIVGGRGTGYGSVSDDDAQQALEKALELGCNFYDTSDNYGLGRSEALIGKTFKGRRHEVFIATKCGWVPDGVVTFVRDLSYHHILAAAERSLKRLQTDYIDVYQLHDLPRDVAEAEETYEAFHRLKRQGKIRYTGISIRNQIDDGLVFLKSSEFDTVQVYFNLLYQEPAETFLKEMYKRKIGVIASIPLSYGLLAGRFTETTRFPDDDFRARWNEGGKQREWFLQQLARVADLGFLNRSREQTLVQAALKFVLSQKEISTVIVGCKNIRHVRENLRAGDAKPLSEKELQRIQELWEKWLRSA